MGLHSTPTTLRRFSPPAACKEQLATSTTILLPSLADLGGVFDTTQGKCPPVGSVEHVTGAPSRFSRAAVPRVDTSTKELSSPSSQSSAPILFSKPQVIPSYGLASPPVTPDDDNAMLAHRQPKASNFMALLFPEHISLVQSQSKAVTIEVPPARWDGFVLEASNGSRTLYLDGQNLAHSALRESVVALLDLADEHFGCSALIIALHRTSKGLDEIVHSLMYVGGQVVTRTPFKVNNTYVLIGLEI